MKIRIPAILIFVLMLVTISDAQNLEIDITSSAQFSKIAFHHSSPVDTDSNENYDNSGFNYLIGVTKNLNKNWWLRTELGYTFNNSFIAASYSYDEGFGQQNKALVTYITNEKIHMGIFPEYRINKNKVTLFFHGGLFVAKDIGISMSTLDRVLLPKSIMPAFKINGGLITGGKKIKLKLFAGHIWFGRSTLFNIYQPKVSYKSLSLGLSIVYSL